MRRERGPSRRGPTDHLEDGSAIMVWTLHNLEQNDLRRDPLQLSARHSPKQVLDRFSLKSDACLRLIVQRTIESTHVEVDPRSHDALIVRRADPRRALTVGFSGVIADEEAHGSPGDICRATRTSISPQWSS